MLNITLVLTPHILINNKGVFWAEPLIPLGSAFTALTPFSAAPVNGTQDLIFHTSSKQRSLVKETFIITLNSQWKRDVILCDYVGCLFCSVLSCLLKIDRLRCCEISECITKFAKSCRLCRLFGRQKTINKYTFAENIVLLPHKPKSSYQWCGLFELQFNWQSSLFKTLLVKITFEFFLH